jgi:hypothetical protein
LARPSHTGLIAGRCLETGESGDQRKSYFGRDCDLVVRGRVVHVATVRISQSLEGFESQKRKRLTQREFDRLIGRA